MQQTLKLAVFFVLFVTGFSLSCWQGQEQQVIGSNVPTNSTLMAQQCPDDGMTYECHRYDVRASISGVTLQMAIGQCVLQAACPAVNCENFNTVLEVYSDEISINNCCSYCCQSDDCNNFIGDFMTAQCSEAGGFGINWLMILFAGLLSVMSTYAIY